MTMNSTLPMSSVSASHLCNCKTFSIIFRIVFEVGYKMWTFLPSIQIVKGRAAHFRTKIPIVKLKHYRHVIPSISFIITTMWFNVYTIDPRPKCGRERRMITILGNTTVHLLSIRILLFAIWWKLCKTRFDTIKVV